MLRQNHITPGADHPYLGAVYFANAAILARTKHSRARFGKSQRAKRVERVLCCQSVSSVRLRINKALVKHVVMTVSFRRRATYEDATR
eukprot:scaffold104105_cov66-Phaeocystis_antarctica.AAC.9